MIIQRLGHGFCGAIGLLWVITGTQSTLAETFSFRLNGLGTSDIAESRVIRGRMSLDGEERLEPQIFDFEMQHGDRGDQQSFDLGIRNQGESVFEAVFEIFGLSSRLERGPVDVTISGDVNPTDSDIKVTFGDDMPGMNINIKTPQ